MVAADELNTHIECFYTIEQVATRTELTKRTLRYYEEMGLLPPTTRTEGNYRQYSEEDIHRIQRIKELRDLLGFSLTDIRELLHSDDERGVIQAAYRSETEVSAKLEQLDRSDDLLRDQLHLIEQKITGLEKMRATLFAKLEHHQDSRNRLLQDKNH